MITRPSEEELAKISAALPGDELIWVHGNTWDRVTAYDRVTVVRKTATRIMVRSSQYNEVAFHLKNGRCVGTDRYIDHVHWPEGEILEREREYRKSVALTRMREKITGDIHRLCYDDVLEVFELIKHLKAERQKEKEKGERKGEGAIADNV